MRFPLVSALTDRAAASRLQRALDRAEHLVSAGEAPDRALRLAAADLDLESRRLLALASGLTSAASAPPRPDFEGVLEQRLREAASRQTVLRPVRVPARVPAFVPVVASLLLVFAIARGAVVSLPGDALYRVKESGRDARVSLAAGRGEALLRLSFAEDRFSEVERLVDREQLSVLGSPAHNVAAARGRTNPKLAALIAKTLRLAERDLRSAARVLLTVEDPQTLERLETVARKGVETVTQVAQTITLTVAAKQPVLAMGVQMQTIERQASAELEKIEASPPAHTEEACPSPEPTASPSPEPSPRASASPSPSPRPTASPSPRPTGSPSPSPSPAASPSPSPAQDRCAEPSPPAGSPSPAPGGEPSPESKQTAQPVRESPRRSPQPSPAAGPEETLEPSPVVPTATKCTWVDRFFTGC